MATAAPALGQEQTPTPSAEELWKTYPLKATPTATSEPRNAPTPAAAATGEPSGGDDGTATPAILALIVVAALAGGGAALLARRRRDGRTPARPALTMPVAAAIRRSAPLLTWPAPTAVARASGNGRQPPEGGRPSPPLRAADPPADPPARDPSGAAPPDPAVAWTAEIDWREKDGAGQFRVVARSRDGRTAVVGESASLAWPPSGSAEVEALTVAADRLEASLLGAGWTKLAPGPAWYARRFGWEPAPAPAPVRPPRLAGGGSGRFRRSREWPSDALERWRCEITWHAGYVTSYFEATVYQPGRKRGKPAGESEHFKWMLMADPEPQAAQLREARRLAAALQQAGWQRLDHGPTWYAARFVWPGDGAPPERLEPARAIEGGSR